MSDSLTLQNKDQTPTAKEAQTAGNSNQTPSAPANKLTAYIGMLAVAATTLNCVTTSRYEKDQKELQGKIETLRNSDKRNTLRITHNTEAMQFNREEINRNTGDVDQNRRAINQNREAIGQNRQAINDNRQDINTNTDRIDVLQKKSTTCARGYEPVAKRTADGADLARDDNGNLVVECAKNPNYVTPVPSAGGYVNAEDKGKARNAVRNATNETGCTAKIHGDESPFFVRITQKAKKCTWDQIRKIFTKLQHRDNNE